MRLAKRDADRERAGDFAQGHGRRPRAVRGRMEGKQKKELAKMNRMDKIKSRRWGWMFAPCGFPDLIHLVHLR
jgi:hypothetical protein